MVVELRLLGRFAVLRNGTEIPAAEFGGRKVRALLRVLATRRNEFVSHDALTEMLWGDRPPSDPAANLQVLVNRARRALGTPDLVVTGPGGYALADSPDCVVDAEIFLAAITRAQRQDDPRIALQALTEALADGSGEPLAEDAYADWAGEFRDRIRRTRQAAIEQAAQLASDLGDFSSAVELASTAVEAEPLREIAVLTLVRALAALGDRAGALARYDDYRRLLAAELGLDPSEEAVALQQSLLTGGTDRPRSPRRSRTVAGFAELPFVGREQELCTALLALGGPRGATVLLEGASGAGKSRLLSVLAGRMPALVARAYLPERAEPWALTRNLLRELLAQDVTQPDRLPSPLRAGLASVLPELGASDELADPASRRALVQEATLRLLATADGIVVVDDLQWADPSSIALLEIARARLPQLRLLLAARPEEMAYDDEAAAMLRRSPPDLVLPLRGLSRDDLDHLVCDEALATALLEDSDGTPLVVTEVLRGLAGDGLVTRQPDGRWQSVTAEAVATARRLCRDGKHRAIAARADAQPPPARSVLDVLSLLGRESTSDLVARATTGDERAVVQHLSRLAHAGLARLGEAGWTTAHDMVTEALTARMSPPHRAALHGSLARALDELDADPAELARHWHGAGDAVRAATAYVRAARRALDGFADVEAIRLADEGLALATEARTAAQLRDVRATARSRVGDLAGAREDLRIALAAQTTGPDRSRVLARLAMLASGADDLLRASELAEMAVLEAGDDRAAQAHALEVASVLDMNLDRQERSQQRSAAALANYRELGDAQGAARVMDARAMATFLGGDIAAGADQLRRVANLFEDFGDLVHVVTPRSTSGHALVFGNRAAEGLVATTAALDLARTLGHPEGQAYSLWHRAEALAALGRADEAAMEARDALSIAMRLGHRGWTATSWRAVGIAAQAAGDLDAALAAYRESLTSSAHLDLFACWAAARAAMVLVALGDPDAARPLVRQALAQGPPLGHFEARLAQVELAVAGEDPDAVRLAADALALAKAAGALQGTERLTELAAAVPGPRQPSLEVEHRNPR